MGNVLHCKRSLKMLWGSSAAYACAVWLAKLLLLASQLVQLRLADAVPDQKLLLTHPQIRYATSSMLLQD